MTDVLVVDDDADMREIIVHALEYAGYAARTARHGAEALALVEQARPGLILLDVLMPVMDGPTFARELRRRHAQVPPIVVMTAAEHATQRATEIGAVDVLSKPFDVRELFRVVGRHLARTPSDTRSRA